jgi:hypothetical protein
MNRSTFAAVVAVVAFALGAAAVLWVALGGSGAHPLALAMTLAIGLVYAAGASELWRLHRDTLALNAALAALPEGGAAGHAIDLRQWLGRLPAPLRDAVRRRIEGERVGLPGPALTPYLVGLLVLLGMLGTFLGLVVTLDGTVLALERTTDLAAMRAALAAPVKGLGVAFGTSVAGVAASAMLGLMSALARRERASSARLLDGAIATTLRGLGRDAQRDAQRSQQLAHVAEALRAQAGLLPGVVEQVQALLARLDTHHSAQQAQLLAGQADFHREAQAQLGTLALSVGQSLRDSLAESARIAGAALQPVAEATMAGIARESSAVQARLAESAQAQLDGLGARAQSTVAALGEGLRQQAAALAEGVAQAHATLRAEAAAQDAQRQVAWTQALQDLAATLQQQARDTQAQAKRDQTALAADLARGAEALQQQVAAQARDTVTEVAAQARSTIAEVARLTETAAEAPRAAADVIAQLRGQLTESLERDQALLAERARLTEVLTSLIDDAQRATVAQHGAVQTLVAAAEGLMQRTGEQLQQHVQAVATQQADVAVRLNGSAVEVASLGEAFGAAVQQFGANSGALVAQLARIESALDQSAARHDEQLAYYVAQAREVIDLSLSAQQPLVEALQRLAAPAAQAA